MLSNKENTVITTNGPLREGALVRLPDVLEVVPFRKSTLWTKVKRGEFPQPVRLSSRCTAWRATEVNLWLAAQ